MSRDSSMDKPYNTLFKTELFILNVIDSFEYKIDIVFLLYDALYLLF
jgi:hypothetical protein